MSGSTLPTSPPRGFSLEGATVIHQYGDRTVYKIRDDFILKQVRYSRHNSEAATHQFIADNTTIPAPFVYGEWLSTDRRFHYLLEGRIASPTLAACWSRLSTATKLDLAEQVVAWMARLSRFRADRMQSLSQTRLPNNCFVPSPDAGRAYLSGRWRDGDEIFHHEFRPALVRRGVPPALVSALRRTMPPCRGQLALTHCDLYLGNVMVDPRRGVVTAVIDWESAGFWPEWFQYARITHGCSRDDGEWKWILSRLMRGRIPHGEHGRVWWDAVQTLLVSPDSGMARAWLELLGRFMRREVGVTALREYQNVGLRAGEGATEQLTRREAMLNNRGVRGVEGYYSTALGGRW